MDSRKIIPLIFICLVAFSESNHTTQQRNYTFDKRYVGVEFSPYVGVEFNPHVESNVLPTFNTYSVAEIKEMLRLISTKFTYVSTFSMGVHELNSHNRWNNTNANCLIAKAAAELNLENGCLVISLIQGVTSHANKRVNDAEIENAFSAILYANELFPGTVTGIVYSMGTSELTEKLRYAKTKSTEFGIQLGARVQFCDSLDSFPSEFLRKVEVYSQFFDFFICMGELSSKDIEMGPFIAAKNLTIKYIRYAEEFHKMNPKLEVIMGETSWPSAGWNPLRGSTELYSIQTFYTFWTYLADWAKNASVRLQMYEAFDQPWKSFDNTVDHIQLDGRFGSSHLGWWRRTSNKNITAYAEKVFEPKMETKAVDDHREVKEVIGDASIVMIVMLLILTPLLLLSLLMAFLVYRLKMAKKIVKGLSKHDIRKFHGGLPCSKIVEPNTNVTEEYTNNLPYNKSYEIRKAKIILDERVLLGKGEFGEVYKGQVEVPGGYEDVAIKTAKVPATARNITNLLSELKLMIYIGNHPNVVRLVGAYTKEIKIGIVYVATELCASGSLEDYLRHKSVFRPPPPEIEPEKDVVNLHIFSSWAFQIAQGMQYLGNKKVIHSDLATRNILLAADLTVKIADFGLSRRLYDYTYYIKTSQDPLPWRWMAIESLRSNNFSSKSDVWSYGITVWEIYSMGDVPFPGLSYNINFVGELEQGLRLPTPKYRTDSLHTILMQCWELDPQSRPTFENLSDYFSAAMMDI